MRKPIQFILFTMLISSQAFALVESGFIKNGKKHTVFREGEKVGKSYSELFPDKNQKRSVASMEQGEATIHYQKDDNRICYYISGYGGLTMSCVK
jgi:hypothetical protein